MKKVTAFPANLDANIGVSLLFTIIFFGIILGCLHPGYYIIDDPKIIWTASGYIGGKPVPFLVYSNVLLGMILTPLYSLGTNINWEIWLFICINFVSVWSLLYAVLSAPLPAAYKLAGMAIVLASDAYIILNITYTTITALAGSAGMCSMLVSTKSSGASNKPLFVCAVFLSFTASLIRIQIFALVLCIALSAIVFIYRSLNPGKLIAAFLFIGLLTVSGYVFDKLYLRSSPDWNAYYQYNAVSQLIHDTNRLANAHRTIRNVGWSGNDQELFAHWFYSDPKTFSFANLQYLVNNIPATATDFAADVPVLGSHLLDLSTLPYLLMLLSIWLISLRTTLISKKVILSILASQLVFILENLYLAWAWKISDHVILSILVCVVLLDTIILYGFGWNTLSAPFAQQTNGLRKTALYTFILFPLIAAGWLVISQSLQASIDNKNKQVAYQEILNDLKNLQSAGKISQNALIVSPAHGLPLEWANPLTLEFPGMKYMDMGWITFSPAYEQVLQQFGIQSVPDALYQKSNVYLMGESTFTVFLSRYYQEHENITVSFQSIYSMPNTHGFPEYDDVHLYKVSK